MACGADLGVGRFCLNCGHPIGAPAPARREAPPVEPPARTITAPAAAAPDTHRPTARPPAEQPPAERGPIEQPPAEQAIAPPVQAADPTPVAPTSPPDLTDEPTTRRREWDPREDLLPYEEFDDLDSEAPIRGRAWIAWVGGAVLLVGLVFVLLRVFATDGEDVATDPGDSGASSAASGNGGEGAPEESASQEAERPRGVGRLTQLATGATFAVPGTAPPTTDFDGTLVAYEANQMGDANPATTWRTEGDATGQTITVTLAQPSVVNRVGLVNGYAKQVAGVDWYPNNRRILAVTWGFDDGTTVEQTFAERPAMQRLKVPPVETGTVTITITSVTPPGAGNLGRDYTAISEVSIIGRPAG